VETENGGAADDEAAAAEDAPEQVEGEEDNSGIDGAWVSADRSATQIRDGSHWRIVDAGGSPQDDSSGALSFSGLRHPVDPHAEWSQMLRLNRELFGYFNSKVGDKKPWTQPMAGLYGPKAMVINQRAGPAGPVSPAAWGAVG